MPPRLGNQQPNGGRRRRPEEFRDGTHEPQSSDLSGHAEKLLPIQRPKDVSLHCHVVDQQGVRAGHSEKEAVLGTDGQHVGLGDERAEKGRVSPVRVLCSLPESRRERLDARPTGRGKAHHPRQVSAGHRTWLLDQVGHGIILSTPPDPPQSWHPWHALTTLLPLLVGSGPSHGSTLTPPLTVAFGQSQKVQSTEQRPDLGNRKSGRDRQSRDRDTLAYWER